VLTKKHGFTPPGTNIPATVFRALYTQKKCGDPNEQRYCCRKESLPRTGQWAKQNMGSLESLSGKQGRDFQRVNEGTQEAVGPVSSRVHGLPTLRKQNSKRSVGRWRVLIENIISYLPLEILCENLRFYDHFHHLS
jgi:hypothetical protein